MSRWLLRSITRSPAQQSACKDLGRNGQRPAITPEATYTPIPNRAGSRLLKNPMPRFDHHVIRF
ncbi:IMP cyclohydrolase / Phosphoribosylaminoimidazolecarboxamide formyltransferase [Lacticaseibacillus rhamnosus LRHMDP2]|uniref:IMP cyclohydrolase / Phosphoribosylaminoimidazolecarboxamide formyltransferase n=1 Tax=Lacticaseibacillus rhamnosus LRHMDP3 TaxID=1203259 RepID=A0AB33XV15_LACRH|nr:IMP cyclohydrolase / Phosphoribosylaminoimidazolecarboxamide formyltransferase [Lacticaseibacillus rhamnosus LRHMDP3]EKS51633.1 IMP cyclohydrolase / Phosphoribosylaminoimidazolecarboxamide formyltransferase [Lacticaseibacillus rhamnosus LRHMDP2]